MMTEYNTSITHMLTIDGEQFQIYHKERRLYAFVDWKDARERLIKIMTKRIYKKTGIESAYIYFKMANPMRSSRLGNFFIDIKADIKFNFKSLGVEEELELNKIIANNYQIFDSEEIKQVKSMVI